MMRGVKEEFELCPKIAIVAEAIPLVGLSMFYQRPPFLSISDEFDGAAF
jgi:hypothetical protein